MLLARVLFAVVVAAATVPGTHTASDDGKVDLNTASFAELRALPGMGDEYARRVIRFRPYTAKNQLATRGVLPEAEYERIQDVVVAHRSRLTPSKKIS